MKLFNLVATTISVLAASQPLASPETKSSDIWIGLNVNQCLTNASTIPLPKTPTQLYYFPDLYSLAAQQDTAQAVIDAYNAWDIDSIMAYRSHDCKHRVLPASMNRTAKSNDEYRAYLSTIMPLYSNFTVDVKEEIHDAAAHTCIIHASSKAKTKIGPYANEYALILTFTEDGRKVTKFDEFVDSAYSQRFVAALAKEEPTQ